MTVFTCHLKLYSIADNSLIFSFPAQFGIKHICMSELFILYNGAWSLAHHGQMYTIQTTRSKEWVIKMNVSSSASLRTAYFHYVNRGICEFRETLKQLIVSRFFKSTERFAISLFPRRVQAWRLFLNFTTIRRLSPTSAVIGTLWWWWPKTRKIFQLLWHSSPS